jgi:tetratricopeptide (TPR) repeat protein
MGIRIIFSKLLFGDALFAILSALVIIGCASMEDGRTTGSWRCDTKADSAVADGNWSKGLARHEELLAKDPTNCLALFHLGYIWGQLGDRSREIEFYQRSLNCGYTDDDRLFFNLAMADAATAQMDAALTSMEKAIALNPDNADNYFGLGLIRREAGLPEEAIQALTVAVDHDPHLWEARLLLINLYLDASRWEKAQNQLEYIEQNDPNNEDLPQLWETLRRRRIDEHLP